MPRNICPDCARNFKSNRGLSVHRNHCAKRPPNASYHDYFHGDYIEEDLVVEGYDEFEYGEILSNTINGANEADS
jgi:hypothetical protein